VFMKKKRYKFWVFPKKLESKVPVSELLHASRFESACLVIRTLTMTRRSNLSQSYLNFRWSLGGQSSSRSSPHLQSLEHCPARPKTALAASPGSVHKKASSVLRNRDTRRRPASSRLAERRKQDQERDERLRKEKRERRQKLVAERKQHRKEQEEAEKKRIEQERKVREKERVERRRVEREKADRARREHDLKWRCEEVEQIDKERREQKRRDEEEEDGQEEEEEEKEYEHIEALLQVEDKDDNIKTSAEEEEEEDGQEEEEEGKQNEHLETLLQDQDAGGGGDAERS